MPLFRLRFERDYTIREGFDRVIDAPSHAEAVAAATNMVSDFNSDCPDDCSEIDGGDASGFEVMRTTRIEHGAADYLVQPDGQLVPLGE